MKITDSDVQRVEEIFFKGNGTFVDTKNERYEFIKCVDKSIDVEACPGSGKTTSLLAKLYLLSEKMPFIDGKGICVLTHTNVAINEIKNRLGNKADRLFEHPNFFGTIQSFTDRFLAIPAAIHFHHSRPRRISVDESDRRVAHLYQVLPWKSDNKLKEWIYAQSLQGKQDLTSTEKNSLAQEFFVKLKPNYVTGAITAGFPQGRNLLTTSSKSESARAKYSEILELKERVISDGIIGYDEAYILANRYIDKFSEHINKAISNRFAYLFIDEMQDTYEHQNKIIQSIFDDSVIVQRIGDSNQAILNDNNSTSAWEHTDRLCITGSRRFSKPIANLLRTVALNGDSELSGTDEVGIPTYIIPYDNGNETEVLEKFVRLIQELGLDNKPNEYPFKAIGWVGKNKDGLTIKSFFPTFNKAIRRSQMVENLKSFVFSRVHASPKDFRVGFYDCIVEILELCEIKQLGNDRHHNKSTFTTWLKLNYPDQLLNLNSRIALWLKELAPSTKSEYLKLMREYLISELFVELGINLSVKALHFINSDKLIDINADEINSKNIFHKNDLEIEVGTVHSVKGETHCGTLYLETSYHGKTCGEYLIEQMCGQPYVPPKKGDSYKKSCLKIAHVGFSRPTHLLCVAINKYVVGQNLESLKKNGWEIFEWDSLENDNAEFEKRA